MFLLHFFSSLSTKHNWCHNCHNHGRHRQKWPPSAPHEALHFAPMLLFSNGWVTTPIDRRCSFLGGWGCVCPSKCSFVPAMMHCHNIIVFWGPYTPSTASKIISTCLGGYLPSIQCIGVEQKASCGALGGHIRWQQPWSAMVVLVDVGSWRQRQISTVGILKIIYGSIFFIPT